MKRYIGSFCLWLTVFEVGNGLFNQNDFNISIESFLLAIIGILAAIYLKD